jgi:hypothetical protein
MGRQRDGIRANCGAAISDARAATIVTFSETEKPAQISLRGLSLDGPHVEGLAVRTDSSRSWPVLWDLGRDHLEGLWGSGPERGLDAPFISGSSLKR